MRHRRTGYAPNVRRTKDVSTLNAAKASIALGISGAAVEILLFVGLAAAVASFGDAGILATIGLWFLPALVLFVAGILGVVGLVCGVAAANSNAPKRLWCAGIIVSVLPFVLPFVAFLALGIWYFVGAYLT